MTTLHFIRHGQSVWNAEIRIQGTSDPDLSELGVSQAKALVGKLPAFDKVYSSDLARTRQTTSNILQGNIDHVDFRPSLREIHLGPWEGVLLKDATEQYPVETDIFRNQPEKFSLDGAESFHELQQRARNAIDEILDECEGHAEHVLVVSHGAFLKSLLIDYAGWGLNDIWTNPHMDNCGHSIVKYTEREPTMLKFADALEW
jgi:probable phosphoglycerate mutase